MERPLYIVLWVQIIPDFAVIVQVGHCFHENREQLGLVDLLLLRVQVLHHTFYFLVIEVINDIVVIDIRRSIVLLFELAVKLIIHIELDLVLINITIDDLNILFIIVVIVRIIVIIIIVVLYRLVIIIFMVDLFLIINIIKSIIFLLLNWFPHHSDFLAFLVLLVVVALVVVLLNDRFVMVSLVGLARMIVRIQTGL